MIYFIYIFIFVFGLMIGSFLNCLIWRLHEKIPLTPFIKGAGDLWKRSYCPKCKKQIAWYDNIPLLSFILLGGKCRQCGQSISWQYPTVELITGILFTIAFVINLNKIEFEMFPNYQFLISNFQLMTNSQFLIFLIRDWFLIAVMVVIFVYDLRWYMILDVITLPACAVVLALNILISVNQCGQCFQWFSLWNMLFSGIIGGSFFLLQFLISQGKWIGGGDIRLGLLMGLILGWPQILVALIISYFLGSIISIGLVSAGKKQWGSQIPLGVFLSVGTVITLLWGQEILQWYMEMF